MTHHDRNSWRKSIPGNLRSSSPIDTRDSTTVFPFRTEDKTQTDSERTRHHLHRFFEELRRRAEH
jgi:hypothetical protein